jgi:transcriptional regulator with XRE-family HTH domain
MTSWDDLKRQISSIPEEEKQALEFTAFLVAKIIERRKQLNITQEHLAQITGLKQSAIARIESANLVPKISTIQKLATALGLKLDLVVDEEAVSIGY